MSQQKQHKLLHIAYYNPATQMSKPPYRRVYLDILKNFVASLRPRQIKGDLKGTDHFGNKYYEIPANPSLGKRRPSRWFEPKIEDDFEQERPAEWEAWLRGRRKEPPSEEEVLTNLRLIEMKKKNALVVDAKGGKPTPMKKGMESFPVRPEYELVPGKKK